MVGQGVTEKALADGHRVIALDMGPTSLRKGEEGNLKYHQLDATDYEAYYKIVKEEGCTAIIHLAATFNKFGQDGNLTSNVHSNVSPRLVDFTSVPMPLVMSERYLSRRSQDPTGDSGEVAR